MYRRCAGHIRDTMRESSYSNRGAAAIATNQTLRRCYSRVKERGVGKRKSSYTFEQLERVFGQGGWDTQTCQPVLINSSGLYQEMESDGSTMEDYSQDDWGNHSQDMQGFPGEDLEEISLPKRPPKNREPPEDVQKKELLQTIMHILESVQLKWELFQSWTDFSRLHLSNKLAIFGIGYNTRWKEDIRYHYAEISSQVPLGKRLQLSLALLEVHVEQKSVTAIEGQSITLPVWYSSSSDEKPYITWYIERAQEEQILKYMDGEVDVVEGFRGRLDFVYKMPAKNISIVINKTLATDTGKYRCYVNVLKDQPVGSSNIGKINVSILVPPSKPTCELHGDPYIGANVTLTCKSSSGHPVPTYSWIKKAAVNVIYFPPVHDAVKGTLTLTNLSSENTGMYVCTSRNTAGVSECNITMEVKAVSRAAIIIGAVLGSIAGLCLLVILILGLIYLYRRGMKTTQEETENDIKEDAPAPKTLPWPKGNDSSLAYKNGTLSSVGSHRDHKPYPPKSPSDTTSVNTATGSNLGYKPPYVNGRVTTPTPSMSSQSLPTYMAPTNGNYYSTAVPTNRGTLQKTNNGIEQQPPKKDIINIPTGVTPSNLVRMGAVPVMVPAQSQAGSLV
ncbi:myb/SANT-like DNA-binding domain-containing protein 2 isoform X2 [Hyla sarda]|uniref:myb/SANT-like DNA-binding domain-containing protein 2 isoform X2 n=1 Tax=Hyla sarda TaxID=327740 RepID=UPI0024C28414|nr:myb/SANT-like DNA-binding domain-containing protein 2 isoform X2 [Hyla sarda]